MDENIPTKIDHMLELMVNIRDLLELIVKEDIDKAVVKLILQERKDE